jgi:hypothetical protein
MEAYGRNPCGFTDYVCECVMNKGHKTPHACTCGRAWTIEKDVFPQDWRVWSKEELELRFQLLSMNGFKMGKENV